MITFNFGAVSTPIKRGFIANTVISRLVPPESQILALTTTSTVF
jgi:hypothetical protein